jgi:hypothetical protein
VGEACAANSRVQGHARELGIPVSVPVLRPLVAVPVAVSPVVEA